MGAGKKNYVEKNIRKSSNKIYQFRGEMAERFKAVDCKSIEFSHRRFESYFLLQKINYSKYGAVGSAPVLGTGGHVFKSHYFEIIIFFLLTNKLFLSVYQMICIN